MTRCFTSQRDQFHTSILMTPSLLYCNVSKLNKMRECGLDSSGSVTISSERGNKPSDSIKHWELTERLLSPRQVISPTYFVTQYKEKECDLKYWL
jgi:hypothetical protein